MRRLAALAPVAALVWCGAAAAHGDPTSLYLHTRQVFVPTDVPFPAAKRQQLTALVAGANASGFPIRVAVVANSYELGAVQELWRQPRAYARYAAAELADEAKYRGRILVVMPNGFGFQHGQRSPAREYALLRAVPIRPGNAGLLDAASAAVRKLGAGAGVQVEPAAQLPAKDTSNRDRVSIVVAALAGLALVGLVRQLLRRRGQRA